MAKILVLNYEFPPLGGGASQVCFDIAQRYVMRGHEVDVVTMGFRGLPAYEELAGMKVYRVKSWRKKQETCETHEMFSYVVSAIRFIQKHLPIAQYEACHCHFLIPTGLVARQLYRRYGLGYIVTAHGSDVPGYNPDRFTLEHHFTKPLIRQVCREAQAVTSPSLYLKKLLAQSIGYSNAVHIPNGIDLDEMGFDRTVPKEAMILSSGRLLERKGFQTLICAVRELSLPCEVHIAGDGPYRPQLEALAEGSRTKIVFHGWLEKGSPALKSLYERASIYVLASSKENASVALLEGMAAGCAVVSTKVSGCPETVGDAGFLIDYGDVNALREVLVRLCTDRELMWDYGESSYARVAAQFSWEKHIDAYLKLLL